MQNGPEILTLFKRFCRVSPSALDGRVMWGGSDPDRRQILVAEKSYLKLLYPMQSTSTPRTFPPPWPKGRVRWIALVVLLGTLSAAHAQEITGRVNDSGDSSPLPGASIIVKGTTIGTTTDGDGEYRLPVEDANATLVFHSLATKPRKYRSTAAPALMSPWYRVLNPWKKLWSSATVLRRKRI